ncbi:hypothetical protein ACB098_12G041400 [Castanea mollissima]
MGENTDMSNAMLETNVVQSYFGSIKSIPYLHHTLNCNKDKKQFHKYVTIFNILVRDTIRSVLIIPKDKIVTINSGYELLFDTKLPQVTNQCWLRLLMLDAL